VRTFQRMMLSGLLVSSFARAEAPPSGSFGLHDLTYSGTGCPESTVGANISADNLAFTVLFDAFTVDSSLVKGRRTSRACRLTMQLDVPANWSFALAGVTARGYANLEQGAISAHYIAATLNTAGTLNAQMNFKGPYTSDYQNSIPASTDGPWTTCVKTPTTRVVSINTVTEVKPQVMPPNAPYTTIFPAGLMTVDSVDGEVTHEFRLRWKSCPALNPNGGVFTKTCTLSVGGRTFTGTDTWKDPEGAMQRAAQRAASACAKAFMGTPYETRCVPSMAQCR
jgi:hypothetical protein